ncbi:Transposase [Palleronia marisminoris]|uniref:ISXO2-like transposase domain protein n=1 Tax=Palleronia marisminoris TaxID=315423 RepID=A0A1Y5RQ05_9RHOB|nr:IS1595 family transposase [Palleronia marisminoris]SFG55612.1 Transposase [Palleronia marisminoris]SLN22735.1 ISXO2-like transposase domain protein [Palleronia marisminoris]
MLHHDFRRFLNALDTLNPAQIEDAQMKIRDLRRKTEAISEIEARTNRDHKCPFCGDDRRQKWGRTRTKVQRYRCSGCQKTYSGRTGSAIGRIHRPDLFMVALRDMLGTSAPKSVRKLSRQLGLNKYTIWRWRMLVFSIIGDGGTTRFSGIVEADETYQRESRKGSREWVRHFADPKKVAPPPRPRWEDYTTQGLKMMPGLSRWQLPILTVADRGGARLFQRLPNRKSATLKRAMKPLVPGDAVLCSDGADGYKKVAATGGIEHFVVGSKPGTRVAAGCYHIQNVNSLHARYGEFIKPFRGPATKNLNGYIRWLEVRLAGVRPADVIRAS